ncbi:MAG: phosphatidate cytidylyltransferase [Deferrisomatales bacterium]|nr:phosphatidate cytidylyltransferase [Deferrisomatales bacterium]
MNDRVKTALVLGPLFLAVLFLGGVAVFAVVVALAAAGGAWEARRLFCPEANPLEEAFVAAWAGVIVLGFLSGSAAVPGGLLALGVLLYLGGWAFGPGPTAETLRRWGAVAGAWLLVAFFLGHAVWVRSHGISAVLFLLGVVWAGDTAAYYTGRAFGSSPLAPAVSPNKTLEGSAGGLVASATVAVLLTVLLPVPHSLGGGLLLGAGLNLVAQAGDLLESLLKRCAGVKDSGTVFPGHGGVLDRVDGFLPTLPLYAAILSLGG